MLIPYENFFIGHYDTQKNLKTVTSIIEEGWRIGRYPSINLNTKINWSLKNETYRSWNFHIHSWDMLDRILLAYNDYPNKKELISLAIRVAKNWIMTHIDNEGNAFSEVSPYAWYDMSVGVRAYRLVYIYDAGIQQLLLSKEDENLFFKALQLHSEYLKKEENIAYHSNHGYYQAIGQMAMGRRLSDNYSIFSDIYAQGVCRFKKMLEQQFTSEGVHKEHSPDYHRMVYIALSNVSKSGLIQDESILRFTKKIEENLSWFVTPKQRLVNFGDSNATIMSDDLNLVNKWTSKSMRFVASRGEVGNLPEDTMKLFDEAGYVIIRKKNINTLDFNKYSYLAFNGAFHSRTHKHADDLSFIWHEFGEEILIDAGKYGYIDKTEPGSDLWLKGFWYADPIRMYCESTRAHNTLEFDDSDYPRRNTKPYGSAITEAKELKNGLKIIVAEHKVFKNIKRRRTIVYNPSKWLLVLDWFKDYSGKKHNVKQWFNFSSSVSVVKLLDSFKCNSLKLQNSITVSPLFDKMSMSDVFFGAESPRKKGWSSPDDGVVEKNPAIYFALDNKSTGNLGTLFNCIENDQALGVNRKPNIINSSGRKVRVSWEDNVGIHQLELEKTARETEVRYSCRELKSMSNGGDEGNIVTSLFKRDLQNICSDMIVITVPEELKLSEQYEFLLYDCKENKYIASYINQSNEDLIVDSRKLKKNQQYKYKFRIRKNNKWINSKHGFTFLFRKVKQRDLLATLHFSNKNNDYNQIDFSMFDDKSINWAIKHIVKDGQYYLLKQPTLSKAKKILSYVKKITQIDSLVNENILYMSGFLSTLSHLIIISDIGKTILTEDELKKIEIDCSDIAFKTGSKVALAHYMTSIDRKKAYDYYQDILKKNYSIVENYLTVDAMATYFLDVPEVKEMRKLDPLKDYDYKDREYNICISADTNYFRTYMYAWTQYAIYTPDVNFHFLLICEDKENFLLLVDEYNQYLSMHASFLEKKKPNNIKFYFMRDEGNRTLYACGRFYLANYLFEKGVETLYISDIDQTSKGNIKKYLALLNEKGSDILLPISGDLFEWIPWRNYLAGNIFLRNTNNGKKFIERVVCYSEEGLKVEKSWMLDQNALAYAQSYVPVEHLHLIGDRIFQQFSELSRLFES